MSLPNRVCLSGASTVTNHAWTLSCLFSTFPPDTCWSRVGGGKVPLSPPCGICKSPEACPPPPEPRRYFPLRAGPVFSSVWCWRVGGVGVYALASVFSCLYYERKLAVSQQTQELSATRGRPQLLGTEQGSVRKWVPSLLAVLAQGTIVIFSLLQASLPQGLPF